MEFVTDLLKALETTTAMQRHKISCNSGCNADLWFHGPCTSRSLQDPAKSVTSRLLACNCCSLAALAVVVSAILTSRRWPGVEVIVSLSLPLWDLGRFNWDTRKSWSRGCCSWFAVWKCTILDVSIWGDLAAMLVRHHNRFARICETLVSESPAHWNSVWLIESTPEKLFTWPPEQHLNGDISPVWGATNHYRNRGLRRFWSYSLQCCTPKTKCLFESFG